MIFYGSTILWTLIVLFGPYDVTQGMSSKLLYVHVPTVWIAYLGYSLTFVYSLLYLLKRDHKYDSLALSNAKSGVVFTIVTLVSGSAWGKATWGTWWVWGDARLNLTAILLLVYMGYLVSRSFSYDLDKTAKNSSFIGIFGIIQLPILHFSVIWWRSVHQQASILSQETISTGSAPMSSDILTTLLISLVLVTIVHFSLLKKFNSTSEKLWNDYLNPKNRVKI
ncbi:MAG: cytochrome c biogenesis protein CcsA [Candidatus Actinomarina sp.]|jgi:heme exporter protein C|nr:cytochrome c biogenesis protein CcsA [Actinomycetota bacterium]MBL6833087.1 cytochrome c biogenesis protein CcsA [Candidatus Actinomarina sp.]MBL6836848.1 cytochrome c biogenesis protein CcsA [Candidatus Actinomarina sp.]